jgi:putative DNA primase/helicase
MKKNDATDNATGADLADVEKMREAVEARVSEEGQGDHAKPGVSYIEVSDRGRISINAALLARHLEEKFKPIYHEGGKAGDFYHYEPSRGLWRVLPESEVRRACAEELGTLATTTKTNDALQCLKDITYQAPEAVEPAPMMLNIKNGMIDLEARRRHPDDPGRWLLSHDQKYFSRVQLPVSYRPELGDPRRWIKALCEIFSDNLDKAVVLQQFAGYCLYPKILFPCALFQIGGGGNGKGTVEDVLCAMLGPENVAHISLSRMQDRFGAVELKDKLLNACGETDTGVIDLTRFKAVVSGDEIHAEVKYAGDVKFRPVAKHVISMNAKPALRERSNSLFRRVIPLEYCQQFGGDGGRPMKNRIQDEIIEKELDQVFGWALEALDIVLAQGKIEAPESIHADIAAFKAAMNPLIEFANEACTLDPGAMIRPPELYRVYQAWARDGGMKPLGKNKFYEQMRLGFPGVRRSRPRLPDGSLSSTEFFTGIGVVSNLPFDVE